MLAGDRGVADGEDEAVAAQHLVDGGGGCRVAVLVEQRREAGPEGGAVVVVAGADDERVAAGQERAGGVVLGGGSVVGDVAGDEDGRQVVRELLQVAQDGAGARGGALLRVDVGVADVGDDDHGWASGGRGERWFTRPTVR